MSDGGGGGQNGFCVFEIGMVGFNMFSWNTVETMVLGSTALTELSTIAALLYLCNPGGAPVRKGKGLADS